MARIIVTTDPTTQRAAPVLLEESVYSIHLDNDHNAAQLVERLGWAISDAESTQRAEQALYGMTLPRWPASMRGSPGSGPCQPSPFEPSGSGRSRRHRQGSL